MTGVIGAANLLDARWVGGGRYRSPAEGAPPHGVRTQLGVASAGLRLRNHPRSRLRRGGRARRAARAGPLRGDLGGPGRAG